MEYINITPTWATAVIIHMAALENPNTPYKVKDGARKEILRLAAIVDKKEAGSSDA